MSRHRKTHGGLLGEYPRFVVVVVVTGEHHALGCLTEGAPQTRKPVTRHSPLRFHVIDQACERKQKEANEVERTLLN